MPAPFNKGATLIALRPLKAGGRSLTPGDHFKWRIWAVDERRVGQLVEQRQVGELSQEAYEFAVAQRPPGDVIPWGFTKDGLTALGITFPEDVPEPQSAEAKDTVVVDYDHLEERGGYRLGVKKVGIVTTYDVLTPEGARLNASRLRGERQLEHFLTSLADDQARISGEPPAAESVEAEGQHGEADLAEPTYGGDE